MIAPQELPRHPCGWSPARGAGGRGRRGRCSQQDNSTRRGRNNGAIRKVLGVLATPRNLGARHDGQGGQLLRVQQSERRAAAVAVVCRLALAAARLASAILKPSTAKRLPSRSWVRAMGDAAADACCQLQGATDQIAAPVRQHCDETCANLAVRVLARALEGQVLQSIHLVTQNLAIGRGLEAEQRPGRCVHGKGGCCGGRRRAEDGVKHSLATVSSAPRRNKYVAGGVARQATRSFQGGPVCADALALQESVAARLLLQQRQRRNLVGIEAIGRLNESHVSRVCADRGHDGRGPPQASHDDGIQEEIPPRHQAG
mmetsp:Transcript_97338/g.280149  ORF Transcript_97338/g.280149 Transcript_97338/m.280149 type:complete len:315 (+) Transcript_97338:441-1385(+)